jgi:hypothetical protein
MPNRARNSKDADDTKTIKFASGANMTINRGQTAPTAKVAAEVSAGV